MEREQTGGTRPAVRVLDLFSGAGGLSEGLRTSSHTADFTTIRAVESDPAAAATYSANHGAGSVFTGPIEKWLTSEEVPEADVVIGGPPCQGFSALGKQDVNDKRNSLWWQYAETVQRAAPKYFVLENVPQFLSSQQRVEFARQCESGGLLEDYAFQAKVLNSANFGAAQIRKRVIVIGHHRDLEFPGFPAPTHSEPQWVTVRQVIGRLRAPTHVIDLPDRWTKHEGRMHPGRFRSTELHVTRHYEDTSLRRFAHIPAGGNRFDIPDQLLAPCWRKHQSGAGDVMGRLRWDRPSVTIRTEFFKPEKGRYLHPSEHRAITHREAARIQGFPDDYRWVGSKVQIARQIGNAVPIALGAAIGRLLTDALRA
ncbi:MAG: DNA cytosine methyltransferase [Nocardioidaceae bacterium]|nr:DNA cytosine methyltransferase [Nocardioidaceae bacterium]